MLNMLAPYRSVSAGPPILEDARGVHINGVAHDGYLNYDNWTSGTDNKLITLSVWIRYADADKNGFFIEGQGSSDFFIRGIRNSGSVYFTVYSAGGAPLYFNTGISIDDIDLHHIMFTVDLSNTSNRKVWVDGVVDTGVTWITYNNNNIRWVHSKNQQIWEEWIPDQNEFIGSIAEFWFTNEYIGTEDSNVNKFYYNGYPVDLGSDGSTPTGTQPIAYYSVRDGEAAADFGTNRGSGPDFQTLGLPEVVQVWSESIQILDDAKGAAIDGVSNDGFRNTADWTTGVDNKLFTFSSWFKCDNTNNMLYLDGNSSTSDFRVRAARYFTVAVVSAFNSSATEVLQVRCRANLVNDTYLHHVLVTADLSDTGKRKIWIDGIVDNNASWLTYTNTNIDWVHSRNQKMLDGWNGPDNFRGSIAEMWFTNEYIGIDDDNVNMFFFNGRPVDLGSDGSIPTGNQPIAYYSVRDGDVIADWGTNRGTGPDFFVLGTPTISTLWS